MWELQMFLSSTRMWMWQNIIKLQCAAAHHTDHIHVPWSTSNEIWWWGFLLLFFVSLDQVSSSKNHSNLLNFGNYLRFYLFKQIARWVSILFCRRNLYLSHSIVRVCVCLLSAVLWCTSMDSKGWLKWEKGRMGRVKVYNKNVKCCGMRPHTCTHHNLLFFAFLWISFIHSFSFVF